MTDSVLSDYARDYYDTARAAGWELDDDRPTEADLRADAEHDAWLDERERWRTQ